MRWARTCLLGLALFAPLASCKAADPAGPEVGSNSNWLTACDAPVDCSAENIPECACGVCTRECTDDQDCAGIDDARCALETSAAARSACGASTGTGICLPRCEPGECGEGQACANGACVLAALPSTDLCNALPPATDAQRAREDELLALIEAQRLTPDVACQGQPMSLPQPALRLTPSLTCAARTLAADIADTRSLSITDSEGRDTRARLSLAGYDPLLWADSFALDANNADEAFAYILQDLFNCMALADPDYLDVGIGFSAAGSGDVYVVTLGAR